MEREMKIQLANTNSKAKSQIAKAVVHEDIQRKELEKDISQQTDKFKQWLEEWKRRKEKGEPLFLPKEKKFNISSCVASAITLATSGGSGNTARGAVSNQPTMEDVEEHKAI